MFCPECGTDNSKNQKFCTRCGTSLLAVEYARSIVNEISTGQSNSDLSASSVLKMATLISILGLLFITMGTIFLSLIYSEQQGPPVGLFFGISGLIAMVLIVRRVLRLIDRPEKSSKPFSLPLPVKTNPLNTTMPNPAATTNPSLTEGSQPYYSVTEERTRQLEKQ